MRETGSEVSPVDVKLLLTRNIHILALRAVYFYSRGWQVFRNSDGQNILAFTENSGAVAEGAKHQLLFHHGESARRQNKAGVDKSVQVHCRLVNLQKTRCIVRKGILLLVVEIFWVGTFRAENHLHSFAADVRSLLTYLKSCTFSRNPWRLKLSRMYSSSTSTKNSWPSRSQNQLIQPLPDSLSSSSYRLSK